MMYIIKNNMRYKNLKTVAQRSQKKRYNKKYILQINKWLNKIITPKGGRFEYIYFFFIKKIFKKICTNNNITKRRVYFLCNPNTPLTKKSKNSRMGSGKGYFLRWVFLMKKNAPIIIVKNIPPVILKKVILWWNNTLPFKVKIL